MAFNSRMTVVCVGDIMLDKMINKSGTVAYPGGKAANCAISVRQFTTSVALVGAVGNDEDGRNLVANMAERGVDTRFIRVLKSHKTGSTTTMIGSPEAPMIVERGANLNLEPRHIADSLREIKNVELVNLTLGISGVASEAAIDSAYHFGIPVLLNAAPKPVEPSRRISPAFYRKCALVIVNQPEAIQLTSKSEAKMSDVPALLKALLNLTEGRPVVITLGKYGTSLGIRQNNTDRIWLLPQSSVVNEVDVTGAGDAFCGAFSALLAQHIVRGRISLGDFYSSDTGIDFSEALIDACSLAQAHASRAVTSTGAQTAYLPTLNDFSNGDSGLVL